MFVLILLLATKMLTQHFNIHLHHHLLKPLWRVFTIIYMKQTKLLGLQLMEHVMLFPMKNVLYFYISTIWCTCMVPSIAVSFSSLMSCLPDVAHIFSEWFWDGSIALQAGRSRFISWWCHWNSFIDIICTMALGSTQTPKEMSTRNISWRGVKDWHCRGLTTLPPSCANCLEIWEPQPPGTLTAYPVLYRDCFTLTFAFWDGSSGCIITGITFVFTHHTQYFCCKVLYFKIFSVSVSWNWNIYYQTDRSLC